MFFPKKMIQAKIFIPKDNLSETIHAIGKAAVLHVDNTHRSLFFASLQTRTHTLIELTQKYLDILNISGRKVYDAIFEDFESQIDQIEELLEQMGPSLERVSNDKDNLQKENKRLQLAKKTAASFTDLHIDELLELQEIKMCIALIPEQFLETVVLSFEKYNILTVSSPFGEGTSSAAIFFEGSQKEIVESILHKIDSTIIELEYFSPLKEEQIAGKKIELEQLFDDLKKKFEERLLDINGKLVYIYKILSIKSSLIHKEDHFILEGWIPSDHKKMFKNVIGSARVEYQQVHGEAPVSLNTPKLFKPFEELIENFSYPSYTELNPTILFAFTFLMMFGMMFGDIGHGAVLAIAGYAIGKNNEGYDILGKILISSGISAILFGFLYGSFFGFHHLIPHLLFVPMENIHNILYFSLLIGITIISLSMVLNIFAKMRSREYDRSIFGSSGILWLLLYWFFIGIFIKAVLFDLSVTYELYIALFILSVIFIMFLYKSKNFIKAILETSMEVIEYATNTVSFIRLGAFTLSHASLFLALFSITDIITKNQNEGVVYWLSIIIGNVIIVVLEGIVVAIQTLRLEYYEFFKRFYRGGGIKYQPFDLERNDEKISNI